jgi:hypothetical protein
VLQVGQVVEAEVQPPIGLEALVLQAKVLLVVPHLVVAVMLLVEAVEVMLQQAPMALAHRGVMAVMDI